MDETTIKVLFVKKIRLIKRIYVGCCRSSDKEHLLWIQGVETEPASTYAKRLQGKVQSDGYVVYDVIDAELVT